MENTQQKSNSVIDALKRLERAGSENSRATQKLRESATLVGNKISYEMGLPRGIELPRGYTILGVGEYNQPYLHQSVGAGEWDGEPQFANVEEGASRDVLLRFAADIAEGWLDEVAAFLEERVRESDNAVQVLANGAAQLAPA